MSKKQFKGVILAGGKGSRLYPITKAVNKNLLPIYNQPALFYSIELLSNAGVKDIAIICEERYFGQFNNVLEALEDNTVNIKLISDGEEKKGPGQAVYYAKDFIGNSNTVLIFADNIFDANLQKELNNFDSGALLYLSYVDDPRPYGVVQLDKHDNIFAIEEKPDIPESNWVCTGLHIFDNTLIDKIEHLKPGKNGEYYVVDVLQKYINEKSLKASTDLQFWSDMGTFEGLQRCNNYFYEKSKNKMKISNINISKIKSLIPQFLT